MLKRPQIAAAMIVKDEARCIARCLDSVLPWVDRMVVLDTGSTDGTQELARACGAEVHHLDWPDDFAAARNHVLAIADADWNLILDADERIVSGGETLRAWCDGGPRLGRICVHSMYETPGGPGALDRSWVTRILPRGVRYEGRVHEQAASSLPRQRIDLYVDHDGYLDAQMARKRDRNRPLLLKDLKDRPDDPYILFQLGKEAEGRGHFAEACDHYSGAFRRTEAQAAWRHELVVRNLHCLGQAGRAEEALALADMQMQRWIDSPDFFFVLGNLALDRGVTDPAGAIGRWLPLAVSAWERCLEIGERPDLEGSVAGRGSHLAQQNLDVVRSQLALFRAA